MFRWIIITALTIGITGVSYWGYTEHQEKNALLIHSENTYQRSFHELVYHVDLLHDKIGTSLAMNSHERLSPQLVDIWRLTSEALANVGQLPLTLLPFNKTEEFLSNIGDFTYRTSIRDLNDDKLTDEEVATLRNLYEQAATIKNELREVQHLVLHENLRWMDVELALATNDGQEDNTIINGFKTVEKTVEGFAESSGDSVLIETATKDHEFKNLTGNQIKEDEAKKIGGRLFNVNDDKNIAVSKSGDGSDVPFYSVVYSNGEMTGAMDVSEKGGHPITLLIDRPLQEQKLSLNDGLIKAEQYIKTMGYENMAVFQSQQFDNIGVYTFLYDEQGVRVYTDTMEIKVALDNGEIVGFNGRNYFMNHHNRTIPKPEIKEEEARQFVNKNVNIQEQHLAIIENELGEEVLTYEFIGQLDDDTYRIFISALDGHEERVEKLTQTEINFATSLS